MKVSTYKPSLEQPISYDLNELKSKNNIIQVARDLGLRLHKSAIPCIRWHKHSFNPVKNTFRCWVCGDVGGDVIDLVMQVKNVSRERAIEYLAARAGIEPFTEYQNKSLSNYEDIDKEEIYRQFFENIGKEAGIELFAFASLKGGTVANQTSGLFLE